MTDQELFDQTYVKLLAQGGPAMKTYSGGGMQCAYRGDNDRKCAAGHWIPDELYLPSMEGTGIDSPVMNETKVLAHLTSQGINLKSLQVLQAAHDNAAMAYDLCWSTSLEHEMRWAAHKLGVEFRAPGAAA